MIVGLIGRLFLCAAAVRPVPASTELAHVGDELVRLERRRAQRRRISS